MLYNNGGTFRSDKIIKILSKVLVAISQKEVAFGCLVKFKIAKIIYRKTHIA